MEDKNCLKNLARIAPILVIKSKIISKIVKKINQKTSYLPVSLFLVLFIAILSKMNLKIRILKNLE
jgi:hypothetical protein